MQNMFKNIVLVIALAAIGLVGYQAYRFYVKYVYETKVLREIIGRLEAETRIAEVLVTDEQYNPITQKHTTTIKFLEFDTLGRPLPPKYFTFNGNLIQFQSLVVRFQDMHVAAGDQLRGKSIYLFWKAFVLDGANTQEYEITPLNAVPEGYRIDGPRSAFEDEIWKGFWEYALDGKKAVTKGIKNAQVEAPGTKFVTGVLYTVRIEHDGGIRIDTTPIPEILKGERP